MSEVSPNLTEISSQSLPREYRVYQKFSLPSTFDATHLPKEKSRVAYEPNAFQQRLDTSEFLQEAGFWRPENPSVIADTDIGHDFLTLLNNQDGLDPRSKDWLATLYGLRFSPDESVSEGFRVESTTLDGLRKIHELFGEVVGDEQIHIPEMTDPVVKQWLSRSITINNQWLEVLAAGKWPLFVDPNRTANNVGLAGYPRILQVGDKVYENHGWESDHWGNSVSFPLEGQALLSKGPGLERSWRRSLEEGTIDPLNIRDVSVRDKADPRMSQVSGKTLVIPGVADPYGYRGKKDGTENTVGITKIDKLSATPGYKELLCELVSNTQYTSEEVLRRRIHDFLQLAATGRDFESSSVDPVFQFLSAMPRYVADLKNFIVRHETFQETNGKGGRNATSEEIDETIGGMLTGTVRIANKIRGSVNTERSLPEAA